MKKILYILTLSGLLLCTTHCEDFLYKQPYEDLGKGEALKTLADCQTAMNGVYSGIRGTYNPDGLSIFDICTDNLVPLASFRSTYLNMLKFSWDAGEGTIAAFWTNNYIIIDRANNILAVIDEKEGDATVKNQIKGACLMARAMSHFALVRTYAKVYNSATATSDLGVPYVHESNLDMKPRDNMQKVYEYILEDLGTVINGNLLTNTKVDYFTDAAARLLRSRVLLYMGNFPAVISEYQNFQTLYGATYTLSTGDDFTKIWTLDTGSEIIFRNPYAQNEFSQAIAIGDFWIGDSQTTAKPEFMPTKNNIKNGLYDLYPTGDIRLTTYYRQIATQNDGNQYLVWKYPGNLELSASYRTNALKIFRYSELVLNYAEALAQTNDLTGARTAINSIRTARTSATYDNPFTSQSEAMEYIFLERRLEFPFEGHYFHDLKRFGKSFVRLTQIGSHAVLSPLTVNSNNHRWVWPIPTDEINGNTLMVQNDNY